MPDPREDDGPRSRDRGPETPTCGWPSYRHCAPRLPAASPGTSGVGIRRPRRERPRWPTKGRPWHGSEGGWDARLVHRPRAGCHFWGSTLHSPGRPASGESSSGRWATRHRDCEASALRGPAVRRVEPVRHSWAQASPVEHAVLERSPLLHGHHRFQRHNTAWRTSTWAHPQLIAIPRFVHGRGRACS